MTTPTNVKRGWSIDLGLMGQVGSRDTGIVSRAMLGYGVIEDLEISISAPIVSSAPFSPTRTTAMMPASSDLEAIGAWRLHGEVRQVAPAWRLLPILGY